MNSSAVYNIIPLLLSNLMLLVFDNSTQLRPNKLFNEQLF